MVTCKVDSAVVPKMSRPRKSSSSNSSGFRLLDNDHMDAQSSISRNSIYKIKIDSMFDDTRSIRSHNRFDDRLGSHRTRSIIMYGKSELKNNITNNNNNRTKLNASISSLTTATPTANILSANIDDNKNQLKNEKDVSRTKSKSDKRINNTVQAQIERMFTDVVKDATCSFDVKCLGSLPLNDKVTSLQGLQEPLRQLYLNELTEMNPINGFLDICANGLRIRKSAQEQTDLSVITPFHNIAVWSAVKFVISKADGGAAFLPLITDPENIDKTSLFHPLTVAEERRLTSDFHAPIFAVVMRSSGIPKVLECHAFVCQSAEDAIVVAATLYQSLMAHVSSSSSSRRSAKKRTPRNQNGVSCISIASSSALTGSNYMSGSAIIRKNSLRNSSSKSPPTPVRSIRKKRSGHSSDNQSALESNRETASEERKKKSYKSKKAPPIPTPARNIPQIKGDSAIEDFDSAYSTGKIPTQNNRNGTGDSLYHSRSGPNSTGGGLSEGGDILTRVAIPRSGSFLNTGGLTRYKSRATRRHSGKSGGSDECVIGGGGGSPLGFSELFNEFRLHENLHSLDDILSAIINADGMSFNDLKPIYKEFLLKLAVTLTKDELYQRSKNIMRRQKKKKQKRKNNNGQIKGKFHFGAGLRNVFRFGKFRSKSFNNKTMNSKNKIIGSQGMKSSDKRKESSRATTGSDLSRHDNILIGLNRNSSSGYVSCSECSYDSEACTCTTADRCYCSMGDGNNNKTNRLAKNHQSKKSSAKNGGHSSTQGRRESLISCHTEDKCYCSLDDTPVDDTSDTTFCDTDSCVSASKCYCKRSELKHDQRQRETSSSEKVSILNEKNYRNKSLKANEKFGLDYDLFSVSGGGHKNHSSRRHHNISNYIARSVGPHEAMSMKKSVEAAAIFADVKLSQTTDIKNLQSNHNYFNGSKKHSKHESIGSDHHASNKKYNSKNNSNGTRHKKSSSADDILSKLESMEKANHHNRNKNILKGGTVGESYYQSMRAVSASLEDSLGYLP